MFRGQQRYVTTCSNCKNTSSRLEAFCELEVNIDKDGEKKREFGGNDGSSVTSGSTSRSKNIPSVTDCISVSNYL